jgi:IPT/TIG domain/Regulator of chromosome condensation (RCC1) repeat
MKFLKLFVLLPLLVCLTGCLSGSSTGAGTGGSGGANPTPTPTPVPAPTVTSINPTSGLTTGGTVVLIGGTNFYATATVSIHGVSCTGVSVLSSTSISCTAGASAAGGPYQVSVTTPSGTGISAGNLFTYTAAPVPTVVSISPRFGASGTTTVTVTGDNFINGALTVKINGLACTTSTFISATEVTCVVQGGLTNGTSYGLSVTDSGGTGNSPMNFVAGTITASSIYYSSYTSDAYCSILSDGSVNCWGPNTNIQNQPTGTPGYTPLLILLPSYAPLTGVTKVSIGGTFACGLVSSGVYCWGYSKPDGSADGQTTLIPTASFGGTVTDIAATNGFLCVLLSTGNAQCLGTGDMFGAGVSYLSTTSHTPVYVQNTSGTGNLLTLTTGITAGSNYMCASENSEAVVCWGGPNEGGAIAGWNGSIAVYPTSVGIGGNGVYANLSSSQWFSCASDPTDGSSAYLYCWGDISGGFQSPNQNWNYSGANINSYVGADGTPLSMVATSQADICILINAGNAGEVYCWGDNTNGEFGNTTITGSNYTSINFNQAPVSTSPGVPMTHISQIAGLCALTTTGIVDCWGPGYGLGIASPPAYDATPGPIATWQ